MASYSMTHPPLGVLKSQWNGEITESRVEMESRHHLIIVQRNQWSERKHDSPMGMWHLTSVAGQGWHPRWSASWSSDSFLLLTKTPRWPSSTPWRPPLAARLHTSHAASVVYSWASPQHPAALFTPTTVPPTSILLPQDPQILQNAWLDVYCSWLWRKTAATQPPH